MEVGWELPSRVRAEVRDGIGWMANAAVGSAGGVEGSAGTKPPANCSEREVEPGGPATFLILFKDLQWENPEKPSFENI